LRPERDDAWYEAKSKDYPDWQMEQEYSKTEDEALGVLKTRKFFDNDVLAEMKVGALKRLNHELSDKFQTVNVYKPPIVGGSMLYLLTLRMARKTPHATVVMDAVTGEEVASSHGKIPADRVAVIHDALARHYNSALNCWETNARAGGIMSEKMKEMATPNQCDFLGIDGKLNPKKGKGWWTSGTKMLEYDYPLEEAVRLHQVTIHTKDCNDEFCQYFVPEGKDQTAPAGGHDDWIRRGAGY